MYRYVVVVFREDQLVDSYYFDDQLPNSTARGGVLGARVLSKNEKFVNGTSDVADQASVVYFFPDKPRAERFAETYAMKYPNWTCAITEISQVFVSEKPKVIKKQVNEKGVLPV
jgi:hypothetical protein